MVRFKRVSFWIGVALLGLGLFYHCRTRPKPLSPAAHALIQKAFSGLSAPIVDVHAHLVGLGTGASGAWLNPKKMSWLHPIKRIQTQLFIRASGVHDRATLDQDYVTKLLERSQAFPEGTRIHLLAFDHAYTANGRIDAEHSEFYVPNEAVVAIARRFPDRIVPVISIHPARKDALAELDRWADQGVRYLKWLPNAQRIDPADPRWEAFYRRMIERGVVLLTHVGEEKAVHSPDAQALGNPVRFRRALDLGLTVIMAHCASLGRNDDLDHPGQTAANFDLFLRVMAEPRYQGRLWGEISALTQINRLPEPLQVVLRRPDLQARLLNGSDYPLPGIDLVIWTRKLVRLGLLTAEERSALNEIFDQNPLLFDFVLKRTLHTREGQSLSPDVFTARPGLPVGLLPLP